MRQKRVLQDGYSLIEMLIVVAIIGLFAAIPLKMLTGNDQRTMLRQHVREVVAEIYRIRNVAATLNRPMRLSIDINGSDPDLFDMEVDIFDYATNSWILDNNNPKIDLERAILHSIIDNGVAADFPLLLPFNASGIQLSIADDTPVLTPRTISFSNEKANGDVITLNLNPLGGIRVTDNFTNY